MLESVFFGLDRRTALFYRAGRRQLQLWLDADGEPEGPAVELDDEEDGPTEQYTQEEIARAMAWVDSLRMDHPNRFANMTLKEVKRERLIARGLMEPGDA